MLFGLIVIQLILGIAAHVLKGIKKIDFLAIRAIRKSHQILGYLMYIMYNVLLLIAWYTTPFFYGFIVWDSFCIIVWALVKFFMPKMQKKVIDYQAIDWTCPNISNI